MNFDMRSFLFGLTYLVFMNILVKPLVTPKKGCSCELLEEINSFTIVIASLDRMSFLGLSPPLSGQGGEKNCSLKSQEGKNPDLFFIV